MSPSPRQKPSLLAILVQYDRRKYPLSLEKLVSVLTRLDTVDFSVLVVDNANPGLWSHEVSQRLVQIGGDNSAWEFSAFDRGVAYLAAAGKTADIYVFATDAFMAYGEGNLNVIDDATLAACLERQAVIGWIDSFGQDLELFGHTYRDWARTSLLFLPPDVLSALSPVATSIDSETIFSSDIEAPFRTSAPLSPNLGQLLLAWLTRQETGIELTEVWHSQIKLSSRTLPFFQAKVSAILREHLLSARLRIAGTPCYDFRLVQRLKARGRDFADVKEDEWAAWQWSAGIEADVSQLPRFNIERFEVPQAVVHGLPSTLEISGWVAASPQPREFALRFANGPIIGGRCDQPRPDVQASRPHIDDAVCGFELEASLDCLLPGRHVVEWIIPGTDVQQVLGTVYVLDRFQFEPDNIFLPEAAYQGQKLPVSVAGTLVCSKPLEIVSVWWNGEETDLAPVFLAATTQTNGLLSYLVSVNGGLLYAKSSPLHALELRFEFRDGETSTWRHSHIVRNEDVLPHTVPTRLLGDLDHQTGAVEIRLKGAVLSNSAEDSILFLQGNRVLAEGSLEPSTNVDLSINWFEIQSISYDLEPGQWDFALALRRPGQAALEIFSRWQDRIERSQPKIHIEDLDAELLRGPTAKYLLRLSGWVENHLLIEQIDVRVDAAEVATIDCSEFRKDVAQHFGQPLIQRQGFRDEIHLGTEPGEHTVELIAIQGGRSAGRWTRQVAFPEPFASACLIESETLDTLERHTATAFWGSITIGGRLFTDLPRVLARLYVDNELVDEQTLLDGQAFELQYAPESPGDYRIRAVFTARERMLYDSGFKTATFVPIALPDELVAGLDRFLDRFELRHVLGPNTTIARLASQLVERQGESFPDFLDLWRQVDRTLTAETSEVPEPIVLPADDLDTARDNSSNRLAVLFVSWEVPCSRHGGGVWMMNLLRVLAKRHNITVVHSYGHGEEHWADEVRSCVSRVISVPRRAGTYRGDTQIPKQYYRDYSSELRSVIETELLTGRYDIVDYQYSRMYTHMSNARTARLLTIFEEGLAAKLLECSELPQGHGAKLDTLSDLFREFYFRAVAMPGAFRHFITVTKEDAEVIHPFLSKAKIFVNTIGIDEKTLAHLEEPEQPRDGESKQLVFLGNYRHPPNVEAAAFFARKVMPGLLLACPKAEFLVLGAHPTTEIESLADLDGVRVLGFVDDYRIYFRSAAAFVAPLFRGAGMRVKVLEAMACGVPVIGTSLSMHGIGAQDEEHYINAESETDFIESTAHCLQYPKKAHSVGIKGRQLIADRHDNELKAREREYIWRTVIEDWRKQQTPSPSPQPRRLEMIR